VLKVHLGLRGAALERRVLDLFERVEIPARVAAGQLPAPDERRHEPARDDRHGHRCQPRLLIADEPTTALDVTIQAQVMDLLARLQREQGLSLVLITHDLALVSEMARRVA